MTEGKPQTVEDSLRSFYQVAVGLWNVAPSEFWRMTFQEWWWLHAVKMEVNKAPGAFTHEDLDDLERFAQEHGETYRRM